MKALESRAEVYVMALRSLTKGEQEAVIARLLEDPQLREDILDLVLIRERREEQTRPFREYLEEKGNRVRKSAVRSHNRTNC